MVRFGTAPGLKKKIQKFRKSDNLSKTKWPWDLNHSTKNISILPVSIHLDTIYGVCDQYLIEEQVLDCKSENTNDKESCVTTVGGTNNEFTVENAERLRKIYEATLAVYIRFVGGVDEYEETPLSDPQVAQ